MAVQDSQDFRLVATDIDGTLTDENGEISLFTIRVLQAVLGQGVPVVLVTGLNPWPVRRYVELIGHGIKALCLNGIFLLDDSELKPGKFIDPGVALDAARFILDRHYVPLVYGADNVSRYIPGSPEAMMRLNTLVRDRPYQPYVAVDDIRALFEVCPAQVSICDAVERGAAIYPELKQAFANRAYVVYQPAGWSGRSWVEVNHPEARKDTALLTFASGKGISADEIVYFGDSLNDIPVFITIAHSVAVGNARPEVMNLAWRITSPNNEDGVARFLVDLFALNI